ncbi:MAG TPA: hypothetical protein PKC49_00345 [Phycisphaerae bacterium]|nr:hypothetical protein [Phycisphaerae bacterium]
MAWVFNDGQLNGLAKLRPGNGLMSGAAANGNAFKAYVDPLAVRRSITSPPGAAWSFQRSAGIEPRRITWLWSICATAGTPAEENLNAIESLIERYIEDGRAYPITDGVRAASYVVLGEAEREQRLGRLRLPDGRWYQQWRLAFLVLAPVRSATSF